MKELLELFEARQRELHVPHAVATVLRVEGSSYRRPGARMLINAHGRVAGSVSGGCLERNVMAQGREALLDGHSRLLHFDTTDADDIAFGSSLGCQGRIWIGIEVLPAGKPWPLENIVQFVRERREPAALVTKIEGTGDSIAFESVIVFADSGNNHASLDAMLREHVTETLQTRKSRFVGDEIDDSHLIEWLAPPVTLWIFGAGLDAVPMVRLAREIGHEITVIDRRPDFATPDHFPAAHDVLTLKPHQIVSRLSPDDRTVAVIMNHHYETDRDVLGVLLPLGLPYVAMLGPKRRTKRILEELLADNRMTQAKNRSLHAPAGLDIGGETPEQIALSILAEIQATLADRAGGKLRYRNAPIHSDSFQHEERPCAVPA